jgi:carbamate kinase
VVPSPEPLEIVEEGVIRRLIDTDVLVVAVGGGGIPVVRDGRELRGVEAVIDKDRASALLASRLGTDCFIISTDADRVYVNYKKPDQRPIDRATASEMARFYDEGQFPPGNMGPKIESALRFLRDGGREVIITSYERLFDAVRGTAGTHIVRGEGQGERREVGGGV